MTGNDTASLAETIAAVAPSSGSGSDAETRFFQGRIALFGIVGIALSSISLVLMVAIGLVMHDSQFELYALTLAGMVPSFLAWRIGRGRPRSLAMLETVDAATTISLVVCFTIMSTQLPLFDRPEVVASMITLVTTTTRAILLPSSPRRTFILSVSVWLMIYAVPFVCYRGAWQPPPGMTRSVFLLAASITTFMWMCTGVTLVTVTSRVIYGLRKEVREAKKLGQYTLLEKLGEGGMGQVFRARHAMLRRPTAVKLLHPDRMGGAEDLARFEREVQLTAQLSHPNVVTVFDYGRTPDGVFYYAMELLDGRDLEDIVEQTGPLPPARAVFVLTQVAAALAEAHAVGLIHRDIKPANIILCARGRSFDVAKVVDFGLVKQLGVEAVTAADSPQGTASGPDVSRAGTIVGTPMYLAPEALGDPGSLDGRADLYALGAVAYFLLTGTVVFGGSSVVEICRQHVMTPPEPPSARLRVLHPERTIPEDLERIILQCLEKSPAARPSSATQLLEALEACSVAGQWTEEDGRAAWDALRDRSGPSAIAVTHDDTKTQVSWTAKTIAVDLARTERIS